MKKLLTLSGFALLFFLFSCGPNAEQQAAMQKHHDDSIALVAQQAQQQADNNAQQAKQQHDADVANLSKYQNMVESRIADIQVAKNQLNDVQGFKFGRTQAEKDAQIKNKTLEIEHIQDNIKDLQNKISEIKNRLEQ